MNEHGSKKGTSAKADEQDSGEAKRDKDADNLFGEGADAPSSPTFSNVDQEQAGPVETQILFEVTRDASESIPRFIHTMIAEYIATRAAWTIFHSQRIALDIERTFVGRHSALDSEKRAKKIEKKFTLATRRLLSLRRSCHYEDLDEILAVVDKRLKICQHDVDRWIVIAAGTARMRQQLDLKVLEFATSTERIKDRITRLNEWLYEVMKAFAHLAQLHRLIYEEIQFQVRQSARDSRFHLHSDIGPKSRVERSDVKEIDALSERSERISRLLDSETLCRETLKYWLLDMAAMQSDEYATSSVGESEATFRPFEGEGEHFDDEEE